MSKTAAQYAAELANRLNKLETAYAMRDVIADIAHDAIRLEEDSKYNGWTNYETWLVNLHLTNDQYVYQSISEVLAPENFQNTSTPTIDQIDALKEWVGSYLDDLTVEDVAEWIKVLNNDLRTAALANVNWQEIIENWNS